MGRGTGSQMSSLVEVERLAQPFTLACIPPPVASCWTERFPPPLNLDLAATFFNQRHLSRRELACSEPGPSKTSSCIPSLP